jgi:hypothetical protein
VVAVRQEGRTPARGSSSKLHVVPVAGGNGRSSRTVARTSISWSPDGKHIVFSARRGKSPGCAFTRRAGGSLHKVIGGGRTADVKPDWVSAGSGASSFLHAHLRKDGTAGDAQGKRWCRRGPSTEEALIVVVGLRLSWRPLCCRSSGVQRCLEAGPRRPAPSVASFGAGFAATAAQASALPSTRDRVTSTKEGGSPEPPVCSPRVHAEQRLEHGLGHQPPHVPRTWTFKVRAATRHSFVGHAPPRSATRTATR